MAFYIIGIIIFLAILGPSFNKYGFNDQNMKRVNMPPRIPGLERVGIASGTRTLTNRRVDNLQDKEKYPEGCVISVINEHQVNGIEMADIVVDYYKLVGAEGEYYWMGTDYLGRDLWTRLWRGGLGFL